MSISPIVLPRTTSLNIFVINGLAHNFLPIQTTVITSYRVQVKYNAYRNHPQTDDKLKEEISYCQNQCTHYKLSKKVKVYMRQSTIVS